MLPFLLSSFAALLRVTSTAVYVYSRAALLHICSRMVFSEGLLLLFDFVLKLPAFLQLIISMLFISATYRL